MFSRPSVITRVIGFPRAIIKFFANKYFGSLSLAFELKLLTIKRKFCVRFGGLETFSKELRPEAV